MYHWLAGSNLSGPTATANSWAVLNAVFNGASSALHNNGGSDSTGNAGTETLTGITAGAGYSGSGYYCSCDIAEIIVANTAINNTLRSQLDSYCDNRYAVY